MLTSDESSSISSRRVRTRLAEFFATLDLGAELAETVRPDIFSSFLRKVFGSRDGLTKAAANFSGLRGHFRDKAELVGLVENLLAADPRNFLLLAHLHRQLRFTNIELVHFFFDTSRLDNLEYYSQLVHDDPEFGSAYQKLASSKKWQGHFSGAEDRLVRLATFKKSIAGYLGSEEKCWHLWRSRIEMDPGVRQRISHFVVNNEDLAQIIDQNAVETTLDRSLRTVNVEMVKKERGSYAPRKVREILASNGFVEHEYGTRNIQELERVLQTESMTGNPYLGYTTEVSWKEVSKKFDFVLVGKSHIGFVLEVNYYSTSMSKIREVVAHFKELKRRCVERYRLIYVTDGVGWLNLGKDVLGMLEFEAKETKNGDQIPFLMNLRIFEEYISRIKAAMKS